MLIDNITTYKALIVSDITQRSLDISNRSSMGDSYNNVCELHSLLSVIDFAELNNDDKEEILSYIINKHKIQKVGLPVINFLNIGL